MGNISSDIQVCECKCSPATRITRSGSGKKSTTSTITKSQVAPNDKEGQGATRVRKNSAGGSTRLVTSVPNLNTTHTYQLRSSTRERQSSLTEKDLWLNEVKNLLVTLPDTTSRSKKYLKENASCRLNELSLAMTKLSVENELAANQIGSKQENVKSPSAKSKKKEKIVGEQKELDILEDLGLPKHVLYYGWFYSEETSNIISSVVMHFFRVCYDQVPQFQRFMLTCCKDEDVRDPFQYYKRPNKRAKPTDPLKYHTTARFLGRDPDIPYQTLVTPFMEKTFRIHLVGLVFTPRTLGIRVKLTDAQQLIFDEKSPDELSAKGIDQTSTLPENEIRKRIQDELDGYRQARKRHQKMHPQCKLKLTLADENDTVFFQKGSTSPAPGALTTSRAHVTVGVAQGVKAKQTGDDLVDVIDLEQRATTSCNSTSSNNFQQDFPVPGAVLRQFGRHGNAFVLYPEGEMIVPGQFNVFI